MYIHDILQKQRAYFQTGETLDVTFRIAMLKKLYSVVKDHEQQIAQAIEADLGKSAFESYMCETGMALSEITYLIKHTAKFAAKRRVPTPMAQFAAKSYQLPVPYGNVLIMSPWNYPLLLTIDPLAAAIAAGNTAVIKPSAYAPETSKLLAQMIVEFKAAANDISNNSSDHIFLLSAPFSLFPVHFFLKRFKRVF